jgi:hypothetical protein
LLHPDGCGRQCASANGPLRPNTLGEVLPPPGESAFVPNTPLFVNHHRFEDILDDSPSEVNHGLSPLTATPGWDIRPIAGHGCISRSSYNETKVVKESPPTPHGRPGLPK